MTKERAAKIILDLINAGEAEYINFSVEEIRAFKKAYVTLNSEPTTNADRIRAMSDEELAKFLDCYCVSASWECPRHHEIKCHECWLDWLKANAKDENPL